MIGPPIRVGVISDTHGHLPGGVADAFDGMVRIIHAGDIDHPQVLDELRRIAPVTAVRGNMDGGAWAERLPGSDMIQVGGVYLYVLHIVERLDIDPASAGVHVVINGHSHRPMNEVRDGVLFFNPGSACYPRNGMPPSVGILDICGDRVHGHIRSL
ncbi:MAG: metallophosphoesterase family protein [Desulfosarcinaceae bacterium]|jgi:putative phosphoesterase